MDKNESRRLDVPGFSFGIQTGEFIDVPQIYGGKPTPKRSGRPHSIREQITAQTVSRARKALLLATRIAKEDYFRRKRVRSRETKKAITIDKPIRACNRRFFEHLGIKASYLAYEEQPEYIISRAKVAYAVHDGLCPLVTTTSVREAQIIQASLAYYGMAVEIIQISLRF
jgi:hypothetical protein